MQSATALLGVVLNGVALEVNLGPFGQETLAAFAAALVQDIATGFSSHAGSEAVLLLADTLRGLEGSLHSGLCLKSCCRKAVESALEGRKGRKTSQRRRGVKTGETLA